METRVSIKSFYSYEPEGNADNLLTFQKNKKLISKKKVKVDNINFKKDDKIFSFKKYIDKQIGLDLNDLFKNGENKKMINGISAKEEDYPSDEEELHKASQKCLDDLANGFDELNNGQLESLFYFNVCKSKIKMDTPLNNLETHILNTPQIETNTSQSEIISSDKDDD